MISFIKPSTVTDYMPLNKPNSMNGIYLAAYKAEHPNHNIKYQDINGKRDIHGDMLDVDLSQYDYIIATPPCNYWSRARGKRCSKYSLETMHLLPSIIAKLLKDERPWIVENVRNDKRFAEYGLLNMPCFIYTIGRHTYWTNIFMPSGIIQRQDFKHHGKVIKYNDMTNKEHQGGYNVHQVIETFLNVIGA